MKKQQVSRADSIFYGRKPLIDFAKNKKSNILEILLSETIKVDAELTEALGFYRGRGVSLKYLSNQELNDLTENANHQGVVFSFLPEQAIEVERLIQIAKSPEGAGIVLLLDEIQDSQNLGSILRVADASGVDGVILPKNRSAKLSPIVRKVSAGASEFVKYSLVANLANTILKFKKNGFWIVGSDIGDSAKDLFDFDFPKPTVLILGSEGKGMKKLTKESCDFLVKIPMFGKIESLNVSQATSILLYEFRRQTK